MSPEILSLLCIASLLILIQTGWLPKLEHDLQVNKKQILGFLFISLILVILPSFPHSSFIQMEPGWLSGIFLFFYLLKHSSTHENFTLASVSLFAGSILFLFHEWQHLNMNWEEPYFRVGTFSLLCLLSLVFSSQLKEQVLICLGGIVVLYAWITIFHYQMMKPFIIGNAEYVDTTWLCILGVIVSHYILRWFGELFFKWKKIGNIFRLKEGD